MKNTPMKIPDATIKQWEEQAKLLILKAGSYEKAHELFLKANHSIEEALKLTTEDK